MFRERLPEDGGMLFRFGAPRVHGFWMKNTLLPLDLLFIDEAGLVVHVAERTVPLTTRPGPLRGTGAGGARGGGRLVRSARRGDR